jgi:hypothetical protein
VSELTAPTSAEPSIALEEERFYIIVPEVMTDAGQARQMEHGRLLAQAFHIGRVIEHRRALAGADYESITAIVLVARNSRELNKLAHSLIGLQLELKLKGHDSFSLSTFKDHNPSVYKTDARVLTAIAAGPVKKSVVDPILDHLELY